MFFPATIALVVSLFTQGIMAAPNGLVPASAAVSATPTIIPAQYTDEFARRSPYTDLASADATASVQPDQIVVVIQSVTNVSADINVALSQVTTSLTIVDLTKISVSAVQGFTKIVTDLGNAVKLLVGAPLISGGIADTVVEVLVGFVQVHQALLSTVIGKHSIFAQFALTAPLVGVLRLIETGVDAFAFALIGLIPTKKAIIQQQIASLDVTVKSSISVYNEFCIPSLTYPKTLPKCFKFGF